MVKKDGRGKDKKMKEKLQGSVAEIFSTKVNGRLPARILISAPAGRGKTTAVAKMAYDWVHREKGSALELLPLLFVVKFRKTSQRTSIGEAIKSQLLSDVDDLTPEGLESFIRENQGICHIILDGLDEYAGISSSNRSLESNMVKVIRWEEFPECRVLVTTRPHLENFFNQNDLSTVYTKMWIEGFSQESSREYINKFFASTSSPDSGHGLKVYLDDQPLIDELAKTPLFCLMVCHLWSDGRLNSETATQTELLDSVNDFLMHHANARATSTDSITEEELIEIIRKLGKVALAGLLDDSKKLVFTPHDFRRVPSILDRACDLGIVSKISVITTRLQRSDKNTAITIEFYHKLAQEHSAGKYLAAKAKSRKRQWPWQTSNLDRVMLKINANIGDYENLIRFAAGTDNSLCIRIMEALLSNSYLDESERYRIILDCSSETKGTEENVSSFVERCVTAQSIVLKSPTVYTVVGMQNLPQQMKHELSAERVTSQSYEGLLSSLHGLEEIDITIGDARSEDISQIQTSLRRHLAGQDLTRIDLSSLQSEENVSSMSRMRMRGLGLLITECQAILSGAVFGLQDAVIDLVQSSTRLMSASLYFEQFSGSLNSAKHVSNIDMLTIKDCQLPTEMTAILWSCLRSFTSLNHLSISDSSLSFPPSLPNIGDYENLIRFAAGTDNSLCIRIMEALLSNRYLDESERYRILLDCSSETRGTEGNVSSLVQRCVTAQSIVLKSPTVYTVVGMQYLPKQLKLQVRTVKLEGSTLTTDVTSGLWTCLKIFWMLDTLIISDSSLSFPPSPPELPYVKKLSAKRVTSQSYKGVLSSIPGVRDIDVSIDVAETSNTFQITTASRPMNQTNAIIMDEQFFVHIRLHALTAPTTDKNIESEETIGGLSLLFEDQTKKIQRLHVSGVRGRDEEALVDLFVKTKQLTYLNSG
eukprot:XP_011662749.1 PREDICTED: uncharacterized protein LOC100890779 [Strongylocentrotus purpuratus]